MESRCRPDRRVEARGAFTLLYLKDECIEVDEQYFRTHRHEIDGVGLASRYGFRGKDLTFLLDWAPHALRVENDLDAEAVSSLPCLRLLSLPTPQGVDLAGLVNLEVLAVTWHRKLRMPRSFPQLRHCSIRKYAPPDKSLAALRDAPLLEALTLVQGDIRSLDGLPASVSDLELVRLPNLWSVEQVPAGLTRLFIERCPNVVDFPQIARCRGLRVLVLDDCGALPSIRFLRELPALERVALTGNTLVTDGDLSPLLEIPSAAFTDRPFYNLTQADLRGSKRGVR